MKLVIENKTPFLNNYYFQTLCLLYFPGEKFPGKTESGNSAFFSLERKSAEQPWFESKVVLKSGETEKEGFFSTKDYSPAIPHDDEFFAVAAVGRAFLQAGEALFGFSLPWGYLTGLRPVKRAKYYIDRGYSDETVTRLFTEDYRVSSEKTSLAISIANTERLMLKDIEPKNCGIYISVPFCPTRCDYCSFVSYSNKKLFSLIPEYIQRLKADIIRTAKVVKDAGFMPVSIYIGGGTPSMLETSLLKELLDCAVKSFSFAPIREFSFEGGRPDTLTDEKLQIIKDSGVTRLCVNPQTLSDSVLERIGRKHSSAQFLDAAERAGKFNFKCLNADLIAGLPLDTQEGFEHSLNTVINLGFSNITVHTLSIKNAAPMRFSETEPYDADGKTARACVESARKILQKNGLFPYYLYRQKNTVGNAENTGYAALGCENLYNVQMMEEYTTVFAVGAGAITKLVCADKLYIERLAFPKYPFEYLESSNDVIGDTVKALKEKDYL